MVFATFFLPLVNPFLWGLLIIWFATKAAWILPLFPGAIYYGALFLLIVGNFFFVYTTVVGMYWAANDIVTKEGIKTTKGQPFAYTMLKYALILPLYWVLLSYASYRALWQLIFMPDKWEKTPHGQKDGKYDTIGDFVTSGEAS
jgi:glycosyltransferase XagB